jgi:hypothetical protein
VARESAEISGTDSHDGKVFEFEVCTTLVMDLIHMSDNLDIPSGDVCSKHISTSG